jgi:hypothetical protein
MLADVQRWEDAAGSSVDEAKKGIGALRPKLLARLQTTDNRESSKWLLEIATQERKKAEQMAKDQQMMFDAMRFIIRHMDGGGYWRYNSSTRRSEWVPGR